ncbi:MAG: tetratricopeptide repeat protein [Nitrospirae bacterium YQR-1]
MKSAHIPVKISVISRIVYPFTIIFFVLIAYFNTLECPFIFDDDAIKKGTVLPTILDPRLLVNLSFLLNYKLNHLNVTGYHVFNIIIHVINGLLIYFLVSLISKTETTDEFHYNYEPAFFIALIFAIHPLELFAVTYTVQRATSLAAMLYLSALFFYIKSRVSNNAALKLNYALSLLCALLAAKTKEITVTLPIVLTICEFIFFKGNIKKRIIYVLPFFLLIPLTIIQVNAIGVDVLLSEPQSNIILNTVKTEAAPGASLIAANRWEYLFTQFKVITTYLQLMFYPDNLTLIHYFPVSRTFFEPKVVSAFLFLLILFVCGAWLIYRGKAGVKTVFLNCFESKLAGFGLLWFFINLAPQSSIVPIHGWMIFEYRAYMASLGIYIAVIVTLFSLFRAQWRLVCSLLLLISAALTFLTYKNNKTWATEITMWEDNVQKEPKHPIPHINLGSAYFAAKRYDDAMAQFQLAIGLSPSIAEAHNNLGLVYERKGLLQDAEDKFKHAMSLDKSYASPAVNLGRLYVNRGMNEQAEVEFKRAIGISRRSPGAHINLGTLYAKMGQKEKAIEEFSKAIAINPNLVEPYVNLGALYADRGLRGLALESLKKAIMIDPSYSEAYNIMGTIDEERGAFTEAAANYLKAVKYNKDSINARHNLAAVYIRQGLIADAAIQYRHILTISPDDVEAKSALFNIQHQQSRQ